MSFLKLFGCHTQDMGDISLLSKDWVFLKRQNLWINADRRLYNEDDLEELDRLIHRNNIYTRKTDDESYVEVKEVA